MRNLGECLFCDGSGKCEECNGTGINPHLSSSDAACPHCSACGKCPECEGSGLSRIGRPREGSILRYAIYVAAVLIGAFGLFLVPNRIVNIVGLVAWFSLLYALLRWHEKRRKRSPPSRF